MGSVTFQDRKIHFSDHGKGKTIVFLHGFTESSEIWKPFAELMQKRFRVVTVDLPGHGKSDCLAGVHTMEMMADAVQAVLEKIRVKPFLLTGHSMGGFVSLAFARKYPEMVRALCLFHSHAFADTPEASRNRDRIIELVRQNKFEFVAQFIPSLFAPRFHEPLGKQIGRMVKKASGMAPEGIIAALEGMKVRDDMTEFLQQLQVPILFIIGGQDPRAPVERMWEHITLPARSEVLFLNNIAHMGYLEAPVETLDVLWSFARRSLR
jgi:pimeloyl-ACP methyl ester carboxylesterase